MAAQQIPGLGQGAIYYPVDQHRGGTEGSNKNEVVGWHKKLTMCETDQPYSKKRT